jgi:hypothetical protein
MTMRRRMMPSLLLFSSPPLLIMLALLLLFAVALLLQLPESCQAYSLYNNNNNRNVDIADFAAQTLSQKSIVRDKNTLHVAGSGSLSRGIHENTIRMMPAGQTPMVPYKVRSTFICVSVCVCVGTEKKRTSALYYCRSSLLLLSSHSPPFFFFRYSTTHAIFWLFSIHI